MVAWSQCRMNHKSMITVVLVPLNSQLPLTRCCLSVLYMLLLAAAYFL